MQIKSASQVNGKTDIKGIITLILKAVSVAMGIAVAVLSILKEIDMYSCFTLLGVGLACAGISLLQSNDMQDG